MSEASTTPAKAALFTVDDGLATTLSADEAFEWGLATSTCAESDLVELATRVGHRLTDGPSPMLGRTWRHLRDTSAHSFAENLNLEAKTISEASRSVAAETAVGVFLAKARK